MASFDYNDSLLLDPFTIYTVIVTADIGDVSVSGTGNIDFTVFVDPQFIIGGDDPGAYSLEFSPGIGNGPIGGVPEPSTWAMMLLGLRRRQLCGVLSNASEKRDGEWRRKPLKSLKTDSEMASP